jgi:hypothetical protein
MLFILGMEVFLTWIKPWDENAVEGTLITFVC